jgi:hypothetical protein
MKGFCSDGDIVIEMRTLTFTFLTLAFQLMAAELTGTWVGSFEIAGPNGQTQADRCYMMVKQSGTRITGTAGPDRGVQWRIQDGKADGDRITFAVFPPEGGRLTFELRLAGGHLKGEARGENQGMAFEAKVDLTRKTD